MRMKKNIERAETCADRNPTGEGHSGIGGFRRITDIAALERYIDENWVESVAVEENRAVFEPKEDFPPATEKVQEGVDNEEMVPAERSLFSMEAAVQRQEAKRSLEDVVGQLGETFSQTLLRLIDERGLTDPHVYRKANVSRKLFSKIRGDAGYRPSKPTAISFAIALGLGLDETRDLLGRAGFALSNCSRSDVIISYFIENGNCDIFEINRVLDHFGEKAL